MHAEGMRVAEAPRAAGIAHHKRGDIQGLRAVAVLLVVAYHSGLPLPGGFVGVDVFFVISGYVITSLLYRELSRSNGISLVDFYTRRARRILPALALVLMVTLAGAALLQSPFGAQQATAATAVAASVFVANWQILVSSGSYFAEEAEHNPLLHTWSLSVEEQFYFVLPALMVAVWLIARRRGLRPRRALLVVLLGVMALSLLSSVVLTYGWPVDAGRDAELAFYGSPVRAWEFGAGSLIAIAVSRRPAISRRASVLVAWAGLVMVGAAAIMISASSPFPGVLAAVPVMGTALVIAAGTGGNDALVPWLQSRPMVWLGDLSYSWYLWHWPLIVGAVLVFPDSRAATVLAGAGSLVPAWLSYRYVETPVRGSGWRGARVLALAAVCIGAPIAAAAVVYQHAQTYVVQEQGEVSGLARGEIVVVDTGSDLVKAAAVAAVPPWDFYDEPCLQGGPRAPRESCNFGPDDGPRVVLVGDSHAGAYAPGVLAAVLPKGYRAEIRATNQCPFIGLPLVRDGEENRDCQEATRARLAELEADPPALVLIANRSPNYVSAGVGVDGSYRKTRPCVPGEDRRSCADPSDAVALWSDSLATIVTRLQTQGTRVGLLQTAPEHLHGLRACVTGTDVDLDCLTTPREVVDARRPVLDAERSIADELKVETFDPLTILCARDACAQYDGTMFRYRDVSHISRQASEGFAAQIAEVVGELAPR